MLQKEENLRQKLRKIRKKIVKSFLKISSYLVRSTSLRFFIFTEYKLICKTVSYA